MQKGKKMDRLSKRFMFYGGFIAGHIPCGDISDDLKHIHDLIYSEEQGSLVRLPLKMGDTAWAIRNHKGTKYAFEGKVSEMHFTQDMRLCISVKNVARGEFGKTVFATREEAEQSLAEKMKGGAE
jgi:hypothetical protein